MAVLVVEAGAVVLFPAEQEAGTANGVERDDVPGVFGDDVGGDEVDFAGEVGDGAASAAAVGVDAVEAVEELGGTFDLDAVERRNRDACQARRSSWQRTRGIARHAQVPWAPPGAGSSSGKALSRVTRVVGEVAGIEYEVVAFAVAVGFGDAEAKAGGDEEEDEFGELAATA